MDSAELLTRDGFKAINICRRRDGRDSKEEERRKNKNEHSRSNQLNAGRENTDLIRFNGRVLAVVVKNTRVISQARVRRRLTRERDKTGVKGVVESAAGGGTT